MAQAKGGERTQKKRNKADDPEKLTVILLAQEFRLPEVLRHIEAGRIVLVIPATQRPPLAA
jgi:hypothetical protein